MSFENPNRPGRKKGLSALAATTLVLIAGSAALVTWLALTARTPHQTATPAAITVPLNPVTAPAAAPAPPKAPASEAPAADRSAPKAEAPKAETPKAEAPKTAPAAAETAKAEAPKPATPKAEAPKAETPAAETPKAEAPTQTAGLPTPGDGLARAPDPSLIEQGSFGALPRVAPDGRKAWQAYARPFDANDPRPRISIVISGLGLSGAATQSAIQRLPGAVTLGFAPYAKGLEQWIALARAAGHEVLLDLPMEPINFPANDPGPHTLLTSLTSEQNKTRLHWLLSRITGYVGVVNQMGSRFTTSVEHVRPVLEELRDRGLLFVDSRSSLRSVAARTATEIQLPRVINNRFIDAEASRDSIDSRLEELERIARISGFAVGIGQPFPVTIDRLTRWTRDLENRGFALAPVSAMVNAQPD